MVLSCVDSDICCKAEILSIKKRPTLKLSLSNVLCLILVEMKVKAMENDILNHAFTLETFFFDVCQIHLQPSEFVKRSVKIFPEFFLCPIFKKRNSVWASCKG